MNKKIIYAICMTLVMCTVIFASSALAGRILEQRLVETTIATFKGRAGRQMFSIPFDNRESQVTVSDLRVGYKGRVYNLEEAVELGVVYPKLFVFDNGKKQWKTLSKDDALPTGQALLIDVYKTDEITINIIGKFFDSKRPITTLSTGWNYFGKPSQRIVRVSDLCISYKGKTYNLEEAGSAGIVDGCISMFNNRENRWIRLSMSSIIPSGQVFCIYSYKSPVELRMNGLHPIIL